MRAELNEEILRRDAISSFLQRKALAKKLKVLVSRLVSLLQCALGTEYCSVRVCGYVGVYAPYVCVCVSACVCACVCASE